LFTSRPVLIVLPRLAERTKRAGPLVGYGECVFAVPEDVATSVIPLPPTKLRVREQEQDQMRKRNLGRWAIRLVLIAAVAAGALAGGIAVANADSMNVTTDVSWNKLDVSWN
jgi:hypothetical protein